MSEHSPSNSLLDQIREECARVGFDWPSNDTRRSGPPERVICSDPSATRNAVWHRSKLLRMLDDMTELKDAVNETLAGVVKERNELREKARASHEPAAVQSKIAARDVHYRLIEDFGLANDPSANDVVRRLLEGLTRTTEPPRARHFTPGGDGLAYAWCKVCGLHRQKHVAPNESCPSHEPATELLLRLDEWFAAYMHDRHDHDEAAWLFARVRELREPSAKAVRYPCKNCGRGMLCEGDYCSIACHDAVERPSETKEARPCVHRWTVDGVASRPPDDQTCDGCPMTWKQVQDALRAATETSNAREMLDIPQFLRKGND